MLPLIPALILLFLQGASRVDAGAQGRLGTAVEAAHRSVGHVRISVQGDTLLASLLAAGHDPEISRALFSLFQAEEKPSACPRLPKLAEPAPAPPIAAPPLKYADPCIGEVRSRDGPLSIA